MLTALDKTNFRVSLVAGSNAGAITLTGIATEDEIISVIHWTPGTTCTIADVTSHVTISAANTILPDADYSSDNLIVFWTDKSFGTGYTWDKMQLRCSFVDGSNATTATMTGCATADTIISALHVTTKADNNSLADITANVSITAANTVTFAADYSNDLAIIWWMDADGGTGYVHDKFNIKMNFIDGHATAQTLTGIATEDKLIAVWNGATKANQATITDITSTTKISAANTVAFGSSTANNQIVVWWVDVSI